MKLIAILMEGVTSKRRLLIASLDSNLIVIF